MCELVNAKNRIAKMAQCEWAHIRHRTEKQMQDSVYFHTYELARRINHIPYTGSPREYGTTSIIMVIQQLCNAVCKLEEYKRRVKKAAL